MQSNSIRPRAYENTIGRPSWSPDGSKVAAEKNARVVIVDREDGTVLNQVGPDANWAHSPDWSPGGDRVAFSVFGQHREGESQYWAVYSSAPDGSDQKLEAMHAQEPEYSPDGERIAYQFTKPHHPDKVALLDRESGKTTVVSKDAQLMEDLSWSPGAHQVAYDGRFEGRYHIRVTDITGTKDRQLTDGDGGRFLDKNPEWSPVAPKILFERHLRPSINNALITINPRTGEEKLLLQGNHRNLDAAWSPDGKRIAFVSDRDNEERDLDLFVMDADGKNITQVTDLPGQEYAPSWSPDGKAIAFQRWDREAEGEKETVHIVELDN